MTDERVDPVTLGQMVKNPHAYPIVMLTQGLEYCIAELEELRATQQEIVDDPFSWSGFDE